MDASGVTVIGLGAMGSALARCLVEDGHAVTVWNRTSAKSDAMVELGAVAALSVGDAIAANDVVVVCVCVATRPPTRSSDPPRLLHGSTAGP